jgi:hypothetical protein
MKTFFADFKRSLTDWRWYKELAAGEHRPNLKYLFLLSLCESLLFMIFFAVALYSHILPEGRKVVDMQIPEGHEIVLKDGEVSVNQEMPYRVALPSEERAKNKDGKVNILVIDTEEEAGLSSLEKYETYAFADKHRLVVDQGEGEITAYKLEKYPNFTISRDAAHKFLGTASRFAWLIPIVGILPVLAFSFLGNILITAAAAGLLWIAFRLMSRPLGYANAFAVSIYAYTFIFIVDVFLFVIGQGGFGFMLAVLLLAIMGGTFILLPHRDGDHASAVSLPKEEAPVHEEKSEENVEEVKVEGGTEQKDMQEKKEGESEEK